MSLSKFSVKLDDSLERDDATRALLHLGDNPAVNKDEER